MTILRLVPSQGRDLDRAAAVLEEVTLIRRPSGCYAEVGASGLAAFARALAYVGIKAEETDLDPTPSDGQLPATADDLRPAPAEMVVSDSVRLRRVPLGVATAQVLRRRFALFRAPSLAAQDRCRRLLRGEEVLFAWQRHAMIERRSVRALRSASSLRPVLFDRGSLGAPGRERRTFASEGALARWAFG